MRFIVNNIPSQLGKVQQQYSNLQFKSSFFLFLIIVIFNLCSFKISFNFLQILFLNTHKNQQLYKIIYISNMDTVLNLLQQQKNWKQFLKKSCRKNKINVQIASYFTPNKIKTIYDRFLKIYELKVEDDRTCWLQNQLKAFHWFLVVLSGLKQKLIQNFDEQQWRTMNQIFLNKDQNVMEYQAIKLVNQRINKNKAWIQQEADILTQIIKQNQNSNKWNDIARKLFQRSDHNFFRSGKQCRQRWFNHLDPNKKRGQWQQQQDKLIVGFILKCGRRWSNIAKQLGNHRTQHMVKNRFKTLIIKQKKLSPKTSNQKSLLRQIGKRLLGQNALPIKKQNVVKQQNSQPQDVSDNIQIQSQKQQQNDQMQQRGITKKPEIKILVPKRQHQKQKQQNKHPFDDLQKKSMFRDSIISQVIQDWSKRITVPTPHSSYYELQQIYSPFYINCQGITGITPFLSPSPTIPFFMNTSFSTFDNSFINNQFIKPNKYNNMSEKKYENE